MSGALEALKLFGTKWGPEAKLSAEKIGAFFQNLAKNPEYFATSKEIPSAGNDFLKARALEEKHGLGYGTLKTEEGSLMHRPSGNSIYTANETPLDMARSIQELKLRASKTKDPDDIRLMQSNIANLEDQLAWARSGGMPPDGSFHGIDMMGADAGRGVAKQLYPAFHDWLLAHPGSADLTTILTPANALKKGTYTVGSLEKYGDAFRNKVRTLPEQLDTKYGDANNQGVFHKMDTQSQIGALNAMAATQTNTKLKWLLNLGADKLNTLKMDQAAGILTEASTPKITQLGDAMERAKYLNLSPTRPISSWDDISGISDLVGTISEGIGRPRPLGSDSLRRAAITNDVLSEPKLRPEDMNPDSYRTLARAKGGRVAAPHKSSGPLSLCHCGAK
jgi:hypothetical protein